MKIKTLIILLLLSHFVNGQISINKNPFTSGFSTQASPAITVGYVSQTLSKNTLYVVFLAETGANNAPSISGTTLTWTSIVGFGNSTRRMNAWYCIPSSTVSGEDITIALNSFPLGVKGYTIAVWAFTGVNLQNSIAQAITATETTGADPSITMGSITSQNNAIVAFYFNNTNPFGGTAESGWTEDFDSGYNETPNSGSYVMSRLRTTDNTPTVTASSSTWIGMALEIRAGRRAVVTN